MECHRGFERCSPVLLFFSSKLPGTNLVRDCHVAGGGGEHGEKVIANETETRQVFFLVP